MIKSKHGAYYVVIKYKDLQGRSRQKWYKSGTNYRDAVKLERKILAARDAGEPIVSKTDMPTLEGFLYTWLDTTIKPPARAGGTYENYSLCSRKGVQIFRKDRLRQGHSTSTLSLIQDFAKRRKVVCNLCENDTPSSSYSI